MRIKFRVVSTSKSAIKYEDLLRLSAWNTEPNRKCCWNGPGLTLILVETPYAPVTLVDYGLLYHILE